MMPNQFTRKTWTKIALLAASAAALTMMMTSWIAVTILTAPAKTTIGNLPADLKGRAVEFRSDSGATIRGWFLPGSKGHGVLVLMHGIRSSRSGLVSRARFLSRAGYAVLLFDFQAHGESAGDYITAGYLESRDARAAIEFARAEAPAETVGVIGISMGGAALVLADPAPRVEAAVLEMVYPTIEQAVDDRLRMRLGALGTVLRPLLTAQLPLRYGIRAADLHPIDRVRQIRVPKLFIAGAEDVHTPPWNLANYSQRPLNRKNSGLSMARTIRTCTNSQQARTKNASLVSSANILDKSAHSGASQVILRHRARVCGRTNAKAGCKILRVEWSMDLHVVVEVDI